MEQSERKNQKAWIALSDAVQRVAEILVCKPSTAADILLAYTRREDVQVRVRGYGVDRYDGEFSEPFDPSLEHEFEPHEWHEFFEGDQCDWQFDWENNEFLFSYREASSSAEPECYEKRLRLAGVSFHRTGLHMLLANRATSSSGNKSSGNWSELVQVVALCVRKFGLPGEPNFNQAEAIEFIDYEMEFEADLEKRKVGRTRIQKIFSGITQRVAERPNWCAWVR